LALADAARAPLLAEPTSQLRSGPRAGPGLISAYDLILREPPAELEPDLVLRFGDMPTSKPLRRWLAASGGPTQVVIDPPGRWDEPTRRARALLRSDAAAVATALARQVRPGEQAWIDRWDRAERLAQAAVDELLERERGLTEPALFRHLPAALHGGDQLLLASSMPVRDAEAFLPPTERSLRVFSNRGANGIDGLVSTAIGLAIGGRSVTWCVLGDLGLAHDVGGLANLAAAPDPLRLLVIDNGGGGIFEFLPQADQVARGSHAVRPRLPSRRGARRSRDRRRRTQHAVARGDPAHRQRRPPSADRRRRRCPARALTAPSRAQAASSGSRAPSLTSVSASSPTGSESATMPAPA